MSTVKEELLAAIEIAPDEVLSQTLLFVKKFLDAVENRSISKEYPSSLNGFSEFLQAEGFYEDELIDLYHVAIANK
jgi:hypothetical protein